MKTKKRLLATLLTLAMVFSMLPMGALAEEAVQNPPAETTTETPVQDPVGPPVVQVGPQDTGAGPRAKTAIDAAVSSNATWDGAAQEVATAVTVSGTTTITVTGEVTVKAPITVSSGTVTFSGSGKLVRDAGFVGVMFDVTAGSLTLGAVTLDGKQRAASDSRLVNVSGTGTLNIQDGATLTGNSNRLGGGAVHVATGGTVNMTGGTITGNESQDAGGGVYVDGGIFNMTGGTITGNYSNAGRGGGVYATATANGKLNLSGTPKIFENYRKDSGTPLRESVYLMDVDILNVSGNLEANARVELSVSSHMAADHTIGTCTASITGLDKIIGCDGGTLGLFEAGIDGTNVKWKDSGVRYVKSDGDDTKDGTYAHPYKTIAHAYSQVATGGEIRLLSNLDATEATTFGTADKTVTVTSYTDAATQKADGGWTVKRDAGFTTDSVLKVSNGTVTLNHITLDGNAQWNDAAQLTTRQATNTTAYQLIQITGGELVLNDGATVQNHARVTTVDSVGDKGGAIYLTGSTAKLTMNTGAKLLNNYSGGTSTAGDGGAVSIWDGALFTMNNGTISGNTANRMGGAVRVSSTLSNKGQFVLNGGSITGNALIKLGADQGGGVSVSGGTLAIASVQNATPIVIKDNTLKDGTLSNVRAVANGLALGDMSGKISDIGITADANTVFATSALNADLPYFHSDDLTYGVVLEGTTLKLVALSADVYVANSNTSEGCTIAGDDTHAGTAAAPLLTLGHAYDCVAPDGTIHVMDDLAPVSETIAFNVDKAITITSCLATDPWTDGAPAHTIKRNTGFAATMLDITAGEVTMKHLVLDGNKSAVAATAPLVSVGAGTSLTLNDGATIQNNKNTTNSGLGGGVNVAGTLTMSSGSKITENTLTGTGSTYGGGVYVANAATFQMNGGTISNNIVTASGGSGGGIMVVPGAGTTATVSIGGDALITGNSCGANGAAIHGGAAGSTIAISGTATITGNQITGATFVGGAVYPHFSTITAAGGVKITSNTNNEYKPSNLYLKTGTTLKLSGALTSGANIGVYSAATPTPGHPVQVATGANATDATYFTSDQLNGAGIRAAKSSDTDRTGIYLDATEKAVAKIIYAGGETLYKTFDAAIAAIAGDSSANALDDASGHYKIELLADCTTNEAFPVENITMESTSGQKYTLTVKNIVAPRNGNYTVTNVKIANGMTTDYPEWLHGYSDWKFTGCELSSFAIVGKTATLDTGTVVNGNIRINEITTGNLSIKAGNVPVNGTISINNATSKITLLADSAATSRYHVELGTAAVADRVIFDGATNSMGAIVADLAKKTSISLKTPDPEHLWAAAASTNDVVLKEAQKYYVNSNADDDTAAGTAIDPYKTIAGAYAAAVTADNNKAIHICVLSDLTSAALNVNSTNIDSLTIESYSGNNIKAAAPWTITRKDAAGALLAITKGSVNLTNITLDGKGDTLASNTALVTVATDTALTLGNKATLQNNKSSANGGGVATAGTATMTMNPGSTITGNSTSQFGGGVYVGGTGKFAFTMNGGEISDNHADAVGQSGGGIALDLGVAGTITINGGKIINNTTACNGSAIHSGSASSKLVITGDTTITGNRATANTHLGSAIYQHTGTFAVSGNVNITGNTNLAGEARNVGLENLQTFAIAGPLTGTIGVYTATAPTEAVEVKFATNATPADVAHFRSDIGGRSFVRTGLSSETGEINECLYLDVSPVPVTPTPGPEPDRPDPNVTVEPGPGKVTTFPQNPDPGTKVTVTIEPETGWKIDKVIIVTVPGGDPVVVTGTNPVTYIAPDPNTVKITVKYIRIPTDPKLTGVSKLLETDKHIAYMKGDDMGNFNPEKGITRAETAQMFYNLLRNKDIGEVAKFSDVEAGAWYANAVNALAELKIISGRSADKFAPKDYISRAEFTAIAMRFAASVKGEKTFTDVPADYWAESYIAGAAQYGWINGYDDGTFNPLGNIKRCEATKIVNAMLWRFADTAYVDSAKDLNLFPDVSVNNWAFYDIVEATNPHDFKQDKPGVETWAK